MLHFGDLILHYKLGTRRALSPVSCGKGKSGGRRLFPPCKDHKIRPIFLEFALFGARLTRIRSGGLVRGTSATVAADWRYGKGHYNTG